MNIRRQSLLASLLFIYAFGLKAAIPVISEEPTQWHKVTITLDGPEAAEIDSRPNPFLDYRLTILFKHESGEPSYRVPGYFAADGKAANSSASSGNKWRAHLSPDKPGKWTYEVSFVHGPNVAITDSGGEPLQGLDGL